MKDTEVKSDGSQEVKPGQAKETPGQAAPESNQPITEVELPDGTKVSVEELKAGYQKDADYRRKTAALAAERRQLEADRAAMEQAAPKRSYVNQVAEGVDEEEPNPMQILANEVLALKTAYARDYLNREIDKRVTIYPEADRKAVFDACWSNPRTNIDEEMAQSHETITKKLTERMAQNKSPQTLEEFFKTHPKEKEDYDRKVLDENLRKKAMKSEEAKTVPATGGSSSAESVHEVVKPAKGYSEISKRLKERLKEENKESF